MEFQEISLKGFFFGWVEPCLCIFSINLRVKALTLEYLDSEPPLENLISTFFFSLREIALIFQPRNALTHSPFSFGSIGQRGIQNAANQRDKNPHI